MGVLMGKLSATAADRAALEKMVAAVEGIEDIISKNDYLSEHDTRIKTDKLKVLVGHTPLQVVCGSLLGAAIAIGYDIIANG